jgi:hypothetical protein
VRNWIHQFSIFILEANIFQRNSLAGPQTLSSGGDPIQKPRVVLQAIIKPIILIRKADDNPGRLSVARN